MANALILALFAIVALVDFTGIVGFGYVAVRGARRQDPFSLAIGTLVVMACCASLSTIPMPVATGPGISTGVEG